MDELTRARLRAHLLDTLIAGDTRTSRANTVENAEALAAGDPDKDLGLGARGRDAAGVMRAVASLCGCSDSLDERHGPGYIDPDRTLDGLAALGVRLAKAAADGARMLIVTGHPTGLLPMYQHVARALDARGVTLETPAEDVHLSGVGHPDARWRYLDGVGCLADTANLLHSHQAWPMEELLDAADAPDLVLADHGYAGASIARGLDTVCFTDVNDPAIAVAKADGLVDIVVPLDDNVPPGWYQPLAAYLTGAIPRL